MRMAAGRCGSRWRAEQDRLVLRGIGGEKSKAAGCCGVQQAKRARLPGIGNRGRKMRMAMEQRRKKAGRRNV